MRPLIAICLLGCSRVTAYDFTSTEECPLRERVMLRELQEVPADGAPVQMAAVCPDETRLVTGGCIWGHGVAAVFSVPEAIQGGAAPTEAEPNAWVCGGESTTGRAGTMTTYLVCEHLLLALANLRRGEHPLGALPALVDRFARLWLDDDGQVVVAEDEGAEFGALNLSVHFVSLSWRSDAPTMAPARRFSLNHSAPRCKRAGLGRGLGSLSMPRGGHDHHARRP